MRKIVVQVYKSSNIVNICTILFVLSVMNMPTWSQDNAIVDENDNISLSVVDVQDINEYSLIIVPLFGEDFPTMNNILAGQLVGKFEKEKIENLKVSRNLGDDVSADSVITRVPHYLLDEGYDFVIFVNIRFKKATNYNEVMHTFYLQIFTKGVLKPKYVLSFDISIGSNIGKLETVIDPQVNMLYNNVVNIFRDEVSTTQFTKIYVKLDAESDGQYILRSNEGFLLQESLGNGEFIAYIEKGNRNVLVDKIQGEETITIGGFTGSFDQNAYLLEIPREVERDIIAQSKKAAKIHKYPFNIDIIGGYFFPFYTTATSLYVETPMFMLQLLYNLNKFTPVYFGLRIPYSQAQRPNASSIVINTLGILGTAGYATVFFTNMEFKIGVVSGWAMLSQSNVSDMILREVTHGVALGASSILGYNIPMANVGYLRIFLNADLLALFNEDVFLTKDGVQRNISNMVTHLALMGSLGIGWRF